MAITAGGSTPNVVPDYAEVFYYMRNPNPDIVLDSFERLVKASEGAALGTGTTVEHEVIHGINSLLPNKYLQNIVHANMTKVGGVNYSAADTAFAQKLLPSLATKRTLAEATQIDPLSENHGAGSTDVGDISWFVPTSGLRVSCFAADSPGHSWQNVACIGSTIGEKGTITAAKVLAMSALDLVEKPDVLAAAREDFAKRMESKKYTSLVPKGQKAPTKIR